MYFQKKTFTLNTFAFKSINLKDDDDDDDHYDDDDGVVREDVNGVNHTFLDKV